MSKKIATKKLATGLLKKSLLEVKRLIDYYIDEIDEGLTDEQIESMKEIIKGLDAGCECDPYYGFDCGCGRRYVTKQTALDEIKELERSKNYKEITFRPGENIESALKELKKHSEPVRGLFNGQMLYSDDNIDSAYQKVTGKTKAEFDEIQEKKVKEFKEEEKKHKEAIPELTKEWIEEGRKVLDKKYWENWEETVPIRLNDLYRGMELKCCLDIVEKLNNGCKLQTAKEIIENQDHSGLSFKLVCSMVGSFCDRGDEFVNYILP